MKVARAIIVMTAVGVLLAGCGTKTDEITKLRAEQRQALAELRQQIDTLSTHVLRVREDVRELEGDVFQIRGDLDFTLGAARRAERENAKLAGAGERVPVSGVEASGVAASGEPIPADVVLVAAELTNVRDRLDTLHRMYAADKELAELRDPRRTWEALGDPEELARRLDRFAEVQAGQITDDAARQQFTADIEAYRQQVLARATMTQDEQIQQYSARLTEQLNAESNERRRQWYQRQLDAFASDDEAAVDQILERTQRFENARELGELASKYSISRETLRDNGLQAFGGGPGPGGAGVRSRSSGRRGR